MPDLIEKKIQPISSFQLERTSEYFFPSRSLSPHKGTRDHGAHGNTHTTITFTGTPRCPSGRIPLTDGATPRDSLLVVILQMARTLQSDFLCLDVPLLDNYTCWRLAPSCILQNNQIVIEVVIIFLIQRPQFLFHKFESFFYLFLSLVLFWL